MPGPIDPALNQWQQRFDGALRQAQAPRGQAESPQAFQQRRSQANEALRQLQMSRPTGPSPAPRGAFGNPQAPAPAPSGGGILAPMYNYITNALNGHG